MAIMPPDLTPYDALLVVSFGGPERPEDVVPFLARVTQGRGIPPERLEQVGQHYFLFGGRSPINDQNRALIAAVSRRLRSGGSELPVYWGNRNWDPLLRETVTQMAADGITRAACFVTSAYSSYSGCRQYRENLFAAIDGVAGAPRLDRLRAYFNHPGFLEPFIDAAAAGLGEVAAGERRVAMLFVTHSIPESMNAASGAAGGAYLAQHHSLMESILTAVRERTGLDPEAELVFCSRSGPPQIPWLEPDVNDRIEQLAADGVQAVVLVPIGFVSDHMEVVYDLDTEAKATAERCGIEFRRVATPGVDPRFVDLVVELVAERAATERGETPLRTAVGSLAAADDLCQPGCCANPRVVLPTVGQASAAVESGTAGNA